MGRNHIEVPPESSRQPGATPARGDDSAITIYRCQACGQRKCIPARPLTATPTIHTNCARCGRRRKHCPQGVAPR